MTTPLTSEYSKLRLTQHSTETFNKIKGQYKAGCCKRIGSWFIRVSNHGASLVTTYEIRDSSGQWSGANEHSEAL